MFDAAGIESEMRKRLQAEVFQTALDWWNMTTKCKKTKCPNQLWMNEEMQKWTRALRTFGEIGVAKRHRMLRKMENKGFDGMMVGHVKANAAGVHQMMNLKTRKIHVVRDIRWLDRT